MKKSFSIQQISFCFSSLILAVFFLICTISTLSRQNDGHWNRPRYETSTSYQEAGGSKIDYYLGYKLIEGYDTITEADENGEVTSTPEQKKDSLYGLGCWTGIGLLWGITYIYRKPNLQSNKEILASLSANFVLLVLALQFTNYLIKEGFSLLWPPKARRSIVFYAPFSVKKSEISFHYW